MASGKVHNTVTVTAATATGIALYLTTTMPVIAILAVVVGCLMGIYLTPDLDMPTYNRTENKLRKSKFPPLAILGQLYILYWLPYSWAIPHRSPVSHAPILGTVIRILYILAVTSFLLVLAGLPFSFVPSNAIFIFWAYISSSQYVGYGIAGLMISDTLHWVFDQKWWRYQAKITGVK